MEVLTQGFFVNPRSLAFLATKPAPIITNGLEVLVQEVIAAMATAPSEIIKLSSPIVTHTFFIPLTTVSSISGVGADSGVFCLMGWLPPSVIQRLTCLTSEYLRPNVWSSNPIKSDLKFFNNILSCGLLGPATVGSTVDISNSIMAL